MYKSTYLQIQWLEPEDKRRQPRAVARMDGTFWIGRPLRERLSGKIRVGVQEKERTVAIASDAPDGFSLPKNGCVHLPGLTRAFHRAGLCFPVEFLFEREERTGYWMGRVAPPEKRRDTSQKETSYDWEKMVHAYGWLVDAVADRHAKSTPIEERRSIAALALVEAAQNYAAGLGPVKDYLETYMREKLLEENRRYVAIYSHEWSSMDANFRGEEKDGTWNRHAVIASRVDGIAAVDDRLTTAAFLKRQSGRDREVFRLLIDGKSVEEIAKLCRLTPPQAQKLCEELGRRYAAFSREGRALE